MPAAPVLQIRRGNATVGTGTVPALKPGEPALSLNYYDLFVGFNTSVEGNKFFGSHRYWQREDGNKALRLNLVDKTGIGGTIQLQAPNDHTGVTTYIFPATPQDNKFLRVDADGQMSWQSVTSNATFDNISISTANFTGLTTFSSTAFLDVNSNAEFSGITTFTGEDNTLGVTDSGVLRVKGGVGIASNLTVGAGLTVVKDFYVGGQSYFIGTATFYGGTINLGNETGDVINIDGRIDSHLVPTTDATFDVGISTLRWKNSYFSGIGSFDGGVNANALEIGIGGNGDRIYSTTGTIDLNASTHVLVSNDLHVGGNVTVGGTTVTLLGQDVFIKNKDIILGYTTSITNQDASTDTTANHAGVAIASTEGTPLCSFTGVGNTLPDTYKQMMWFSKDYADMSFDEDMFAFNYGVAVGTTSVTAGNLFAVGSEIRMTNNAIGVGTASPSSALWVNGDGYFTGVVTSSNFYVGNELVGAGGSFTNLNVSGISTFNGNVNIGNGVEDAIIVSGIATFNQSITGTISTATRALTVDVTEDDTYTGSLLFAVGTGATAVLRDNELTYNASTNLLTTAGDVAINGGDVTTTATEFNLINANATTVNFAGAATNMVIGSSSGITTVANNLTVGGDIRVNGGDIEGSDGIKAIELSGNGNVGISSNLTVTGDLFVKGATTTVSTGELKVQDVVIDLGLRDDGTGVLVDPNTATTDVGVVFNYYHTGSSSARKASLFWDRNSQRVSIASSVTEVNGEITAIDWGGLEIGALWVTDCAGQSQVISCTSGQRFLENITVDAGTF